MHDCSLPVTRPLRCLCFHFRTVRQLRCGLVRLGDGGRHVMRNTRHTDGTEEEQSCQCRAMETSTSNFRRRLEALDGTTQHGGHFAG